MNSERFKMVKKIWFFLLPLLFSIVICGSVFAADNNAIGIESSSHAEQSNQGGQGSQQVGDKSVVKDSGDTRSVERESVSDSSGDGLEMQDVIGKDELGNDYEEAQLDIYENGKKTTIRHEGKITIPPPAAKKPSIDLLEEPSSKEPDTKRRYGTKEPKIWKGTMVIKCDSSSKYILNSYPDQDTVTASETCTIEIELEAEQQVYAFSEDREGYLFKPAKVTYQISGAGGGTNHSQKWSGSKTLTTTYSAGWMSIYPKHNFYAINLGNCDYLPVNYVINWYNDPPKSDVAVVEFNFDFMDYFKKGSTEFKGSHSWTIWPVFTPSEQEEKLRRELVAAGDASIEASLIPTGNLDSWIASHQFPPEFAHQIETPYAILEQPNSQIGTSGSITRSVYWFFKKVK